MILRKLLRALPALLLLAPGLLAQGQRDELGRAFQIWFGDFVAEKIDPADVWGPLNDPYLGPKKPPPTNASGQTVVPRRTRLDEAGELFKRLVERGTSEDGERLLKVIETSLKRKGGRIYERNGTFTLFRDVAVQVLASKDCSQAVQTVVAERLRKDLTVTPIGNAGNTDPDAEGTPRKARHSNPDLARVLLPIIGAFGQPHFRTLLEDCLATEDGGIQAAAAAGLADMGYGRAIAAVARALAKAKEIEDIGRLARSVELLVMAKRPPPQDNELKLALEIAQEKAREVKDWRGRMALVPLMRRIRAVSSVPVLIELLAETNESLGKAGKAGRVASGTLQATIHEALLDLTGFYANPDDAPRWRTWWEEVKDTFALAQQQKKAESQQKGPTYANTFFGIPVTGNRVVFVLDISGSMSAPFEPTTVAGQPGQPPAPGTYESKLDRAKKELHKAVGGLPADAKFNVIFFSSSVRVWQDKLVPANSKFKGLLDEYVSRFQPNGMTMLYEAMQQAMDIKLDKPDRRRDGPYGGGSVDEMFVLSDGLPTMGQILDPGRILQIVTDWNRGAQVRIHTIYIETGAADRQRGGVAAGGRLSGAEFMRRLAEQNNGKFVIPKS